MVEIACGEEPPNEVNKAVIGNLFAQHIQQPVVIDAFTTCGDVDFEHPFGASPVAAQAFESGVAAPARPNAVTVVVKRRFVDRLQNEPDACLDDFVPRGRAP